MQAVVIVPDGVELGEKRINEIKAAVKLWLDGESVLVLTGGVTLQVYDSLPSPKLASRSVLPPMSPDVYRSRE